MKKKTFLVFIVSLCFSVIVLADYTQELWNDSVLQNNNWSYYDTDTVSPYDSDMDWHASGGVGNSGYVSAPLNALDWCHNIQAFWPAYLYDAIAGPGQQIDLSIANAKINIYTSGKGDPTGISQFDLKGGHVYFFIGQWLSIGNPGPEDDLYCFFYNMTPVTVNKDNWITQSIIPVGNNSNWGVIAQNDFSINPGELFYHPQQWGFTIFPADATPSGILGFDSFQIVPEPATICLLGIGLFCMKKNQVAE